VHYTAGYIILGDFLSLFAYSLLLEWILRTGRYHPVLKYVSFMIDLTCVSVVAASSLFLSSGPVATSWLAASTVYFLFIALTGIRISPRLCVFMGMAAAVEFTLVNQFAQAIGGLGLPLSQQAAVGAVMVVSGLVLAVSAGNARRLMMRMVLSERERIHIESIAEVTRRQAITDELTGIFNRRHFYDEIRLQIDAALTSNSSCSGITPVIASSHKSQPF
jgi:predicted signal transduction protein with EAL and GGDEF domain